MPLNASELFTAPVIVLDVSLGLDRTVAIEVVPHRSKGRIYFTAPRVLALSTVTKEIDGHLIAKITGGMSRRPDVIASDEDLQRTYGRKDGTPPFILRERKARYELIRPLIQDRENAKLLFDPQIRHEQVHALAKFLHTDKRAIKRAENKIKQILYQYWAEGSDSGAVTPYTGNCGGSGERRQPQKLGRTPVSGERGDPLSDEDKDICGYAWRNYYIRGTTIAKALRRMWREFYSTIGIDAKGRITHDLLPIGQRPKRPQFIRWGIERSPGHDSWKKQLTKFALARLDRSLTGSANQDVVAVGQRGAIDSTGIDVELVSIVNRLERIGQAHRILIVDTLYGYIPGFYIGLDAPSAQSVRLAVLHALTDKTEWLKWLGLFEEQDIAAWIQMRFATVTADNTDLRCDEVIELLDRIGTGIKFVGVARSDLNAPVEVGHHTMHRMVDHNLAGTTHGQRHERGEERADILARHTLIEAIREITRAIYAYNTMELDITPTLEMRRDLVDNGIKLTRANLTRWAMSQGRQACSLISEAEARIKLLLPIRGTFTQSGVRLLRSDTGQKREYLYPVIYRSKHPVLLARMLTAKVSRSRLSPESFDDEFLHDPYSPKRIYYRNRNDGELIPLDAQTDNGDIDLLYECSIPDMIDLMSRNALYLYNVEESRHRQLSEMEAAQEATKQEAENAYKEALSELDKPPSKSSLRRDKSANRMRERERFQHGMPIQQTTASAAASPEGFSTEPGKSSSSSNNEPLDLGRTDTKPIPDGSPTKAPSQPATTPTPESSHAPAGSSLFLSTIRKRRNKETINA